MEESSTSDSDEEAGSESEEEEEDEELGLIARGGVGIPVGEVSGFYSLFGAIWFVGSWGEGGDDVG